MREEKINALVEKFRKDPCVNSKKACMEQITYNEALPKNENAMMQRISDEQTEALKRLLKELV